jgi:hypothetical protein
MNPFVRVRALMLQSPSKGSPLNTVALVVKPSTYELPGDFQDPNSSSQQLESTGQPYMQKIPQNL